MTLRTRIILCYVLLVIGSFSFAIYLVMNDVRPRYLESAEESMVDTAELLAALLSQHISEGALQLASIDGAMSTLSKRTFSAKIFDAEKKNVNLRVYITDHNGIVLYDSTGEAKPGTDFSQWRDVFMTLHGQYGARSTRIDKKDPASSVLYVAAPIMKDGKLFGVVTLGKRQDSVSFFIDIARKKLLVSFALIGITAIALAAALSVWISRPIKRLIGYVHAIRQGKLVKIPDLGSSEIGALGKAIDEMQVELEGKNYIEDYVRALTHEMKSPLTGIKGAGEILREHVSSVQGNKFLNNVDSEVERMQSLVERMLQLSRLENVRAISKARIAAGAFFHELGDSLQIRLSEKKLHLEMDILPSLFLYGDEFLLRQAVNNVLSNSIDFSPSGATITVQATEGKHTLEITVADQGTGIPDFAMPKAFDKFFSLNRPGTGKKSTGLGLPFVKEVISLHGGDIRLANTNPGLEVRITLPLE